MTVASESGPFRPPEADLELLDELACCIRPEDPRLEEWFEEYCRNHRRRLAIDLALVERYAPAGARLLEYGAVPLLMTAALAERGYDVVAVDLAPGRFASSIAARGLAVAECNVETEPLPYPDASVDVVLFNEIFEHLRIDPIFTLGEAHRVLRPGGRLLLSTPNLRSLRGMRNLVVHNQGHAVSAGIYRQYEKLHTLGHMGHVREYTTREVCDFVDRVGFIAERIVYRGGHGRGLVGVVERLAPSLRPFFTLVANRDR